MQHKTVEYFDGQQKLIGEFIYHNDQNNSRATVIVFHAFEGRSKFALTYAEKIAAQGFNVFVADMYGDAKVENTLAGCFNLIGPFLQDRSLVRKRAVFAYETALQQVQVDNNKVGAIGFCFGGMCVLELVRSGAALKAGITAHGVLAKSNLPTHPIKSKLLILHGYQDPQVPPESLSAFAQEMAAINLHDWTFTFFGDAKHSFTDPATGTFDPEKEKEVGREYNPIAARRTFIYAVDFFKEWLK